MEPVPLIPAGGPNEATCRALLRDDFDQGWFDATASAGGLVSEAQFRDRWAHTHAVLDAKTPDQGQLLREEEPAATPPAEAKEAAPEEAKSTGAAAEESKVQRETRSSGGPPQETETVSYTHLTLPTKA